MEKLQNNIKEEIDSLTGEWWEEETMVEEAPGAISCTETLVVAGCKQVPLAEIKMEDPAHAAAGQLRIKRSNVCGALERKRRKRAAVAAPVTTGWVTAKTAQEKSMTIRVGESAATSSLSEEDACPTAEAMKRRRSRTFAQAAKGALRVPIVQDGYPGVNLDGGQVALLESTVGEVVLRAPEEAFIPRFEATFLRGGAAIVVCSDLESADWLRKAVPDLKPWAGAVLRVVSMEDVTKPKKTVAWIPGPPVEPNDVLRLLARQNEGLNTECWVIYGRGVPTQKGYSLDLGVDEPSVKVLRALNWRPHMRLGRISFKEIKKA